MDSAQIHYGFWSLAPPLLALGLALAIRQVYISLLLGVIFGYIILQDGHIVHGAFEALEAMVRVFRDGGNTRTIMFCILVGGLIELIERNGGVRGFVHAFSKHILAASSKSTSRRKVEFYAFLTGCLVFVESSISILTMGTIFKPLFDKLNISRERLAYLADSCSAPVCILLPFNAWGAYVIGILEDYSVDQPVASFVRSIVFNFYPWFALTILLLLIWFQKSPGPLGKFKPVSQQGQNTPESQWSSSPLNMLLPLATMVLTMPFFLAYSGWSERNMDAGSLWHQWVSAVVSGSGSFAVLTAVSLAVFVALILTYRLPKFSLNDTMDITMNGMGKLLPLGILMLLAFAINTLCRELGTGYYVASVIEQSSLNAAWVPAILFSFSAFIAFSTGTSWGTFAIMLGIAIPLSSELGLPLSLVLGAVLGGGVFGDHCSPISDTTIIASTAAECAHIDHVRTQIPYALTAGIISLASYVIVAFLL